MTVSAKGYFNNYIALIVIVCHIGPFFTMDFNMVPSTVGTIALYICNVRGSTNTVRGKTRPSVL